MESPPTNRTLEIDGMSGDLCVQKVARVLQHVQGVATQSVTLGAARIGATQAGCDAACTAISVAGYRAREDTRLSDALPTPASPAP